MAGLLTPAAARSSDAVAHELRHWSTLPFVDGETDCGLSVIAYVEKVSGRVLKPRPRYAGKLGGQRFLKRRGGFVAFGDWALGQLGCARCTQPVRGDVGLVDLPGSGLTACLCLGMTAAADQPWWAARAHFEVVVIAQAPVAAWRVEGDAQCLKR
ncbi:MAG: hypothetical protein VYD90_13235 [Pseudomonadota bacterium]|nr:hypothetical protein [Pseudomonadota bacterium]